MQGYLTLFGEGPADRRRYQLRLPRARAQSGRADNLSDAPDQGASTAVKRQHDPERVVGELLTSEIAEKQARSIKYQMTIAKLPLAKDLEDFDFADTRIDETWFRTSPAVTSLPTSATSC